MATIQQAVVTKRRFQQMEHKSSPASRVPTFKLRYHSLRSVTSPEDQEQGRRRYCGVAPAKSIFEIGTDENVRDFLGRDDEGRRRKSTMVNKAIRETLENNPSDFAILNSGVVIVADGAEVDDGKKAVQLIEASIINGAQTKGVLEEYSAANPDDELPSVSFELLVSDDEDLIANISIARNFQNRVDDISIYGRHGLFDELETAMKRHDRSIILRKSETDFGEDFLDTEKLVQVLTVLAPETIDFPSAQRRGSRIETRYRTYAYRHRSRCLKDFAGVMEDPTRWKDAKRYFLSIAAAAWELYGRLKGEQAFSSLHKVKGEVVAGQKQVASDGVPDGIIFPMLSALSRFVVTTNGRSSIDIPSFFPWATLFTQAEMIFKTTANHNPQTMGKDTDCYVALQGVIEMYFAATKASSARRSTSRA
jgi:hypothetical protein